MTVYDLLRRFAQYTGWTSEEERREAVELIDRLEAANVLGTTAGAMQTREETR